MKHKTSELLLAGRDWLMVVWWLLVAGAFLWIPVGVGMASVVGSLTLADMVVFRGVDREDPRFIVIVLGIAVLFTCLYLTYHLVMFLWRRCYALGDVCADRIDYYLPVKPDS